MSSRIAGRVKLFCGKSCAPLSVSRIDAGLFMQASVCRRRYFAADVRLSKAMSAHESKGKTMGEFKLFRRSDSGGVAIVEIGNPPVNLVDSISWVT